MTLSLHCRVMDRMPKAAPEGKTRAELIEKVAAFYARHQHFDFIDVRGQSAKELGKFAAMIRGAYDLKRVSPELINQLDAIGFPWDGRIYRWNRMLFKIEKAMSEHIRLPHALMTWWRRQRILLDDGQLDAVRAEALSKLRYDTPTDYHWTLVFADVEMNIAFRKPLDYEQTRWLFVQNAQVNKSNRVVHYNRHHVVPEEYHERLATMLNEAQSNGLLDPSYMTPAERRKFLNAQRKRGGRRRNRTYGGEARLG